MRHLFIILFTCMVIFSCQDPAMDQRKTVGNLDKTTGDKSAPGCTPKINGGENNRQIAVAFNEWRIRCAPSDAVAEKTARALYE